MLKKSQLPLILITAFLDILGMSLFIPLLPSIIAGFWVHVSWTGYTQAIYAIGMFLGGLFFGKLSDTYGRKKVLSCTSIINLIAYIIMLYSVWHIDIQTISMIRVTEWENIDFIGINSLLEWITPVFMAYLLARFIGWLWWAGFGVIGAYISDISTPTERVKNMGLMGASFGIAFLIGPAVSWILSNFTSIHTIILLTLVIIAVNVLSIWLFLEEPRKHINREEVHLVDFHFSRTVVILFILSFWATLGFSGMQSMSGQFYTDKFHFTAEQIGYTMALVWFISVLYQGFLVRFIRVYLDEKNMLLFAFIILSFWFIGFGWTENVLWLLFWIALFPIGMWSFNPSIWSLLAKNAPKEVGKVMGYNTSIQSIGQIFWPILAWVLYKTPGTGSPFFMSAGIFILLFFISMSLKNSEIEKKSWK